LVVVNVPARSDRRAYSRLPFDTRSLHWWSIAWRYAVVGWSSFVCLLALTKESVHALAGEHGEELPLTIPKRSP